MRKSKLSQDYVWQRVARSLRYMYQLYQSFLKELVLKGYSVVNVTDRQEAAQHIESTKRCMILSPAMIAVEDKEGLLTRISGVHPKPVIISIQPRN